MPHFLYKAKDSSGRIKSGELNAADKDKLAKSLKDSGLTPFYFEEVKDKRSSIKLSKFLKRVSTVDKMLFARHLRVMLKAGLSFSRAITVLSEQTRNAYFTEILQDVKNNVQKGNSLADSLAKYPKVFNNLFVSMIRVGETSGNLEEVLDMLSLQLKKDHELTSRIKGAMTYPAVIILAMIVIGSLMMMFVVPSILKIFDEMGEELPLTTRLIMDISDIFQNYGAFIFLGVITLTVIFFRIIKTSKGKRYFDYLLLNIPVINGIVSKVNMARFSRTLSSMTASGVSIVESLEVISNTLGNTYYKDSIKRASKDVQKGIPLGEVIGRYDKLYQPLMIHMIEVGEETGTLENTLRQIAEFYEEEINQITSNLSSIIEPILMLIIGGAVGLFAISIIQPMYSIMGSI